MAALDLFILSSTAVDAASSVRCHISSELVSGFSDFQAAALSAMKSGRKVGVSERDVRM